LYVQSPDTDSVADGDEETENGSFTDGYAVYARFFKPVGIAVTPDGSTIYVADAGNNRIRNITCSNLVAPTFAPTAVPTRWPTYTPSTAPTASTSKPTKSTIAPTAAPKAAKGQPTAPTNPKAKGKSLGGGVSAGVSTSNSQISVGAIAMIAVFSFAAAALALALIYNRQRLSDYFLGTAKAIAVPTVESATA